MQEILLALSEIKGTKITWYFMDDDEDMEEAGHEFSQQVEIPFEFKTYWRKNILIDVIPKERWYWYLDPDESIMAQD